MTPKHRENDKMLSERVVSAITEMGEVTPEDVTPLYHSIDPDALDEIFSGDREGRVTFEHAGFRIVVSADGAVTVTESSG